MSERVPQPIPSVPVAASSAGAQDAVREASLATGTESPAEAGADYARPVLPAPSAVATTVTQPAPKHIAVAEALASKSKPVAEPKAPKPVVKPAPEAKAPKPATKATAKPSGEAPANSVASGAGGKGEWKLQLGAFGVSGNAEKLWTKLATRPELAGKKRLLVPAGGLTKLLAGGFESQADAAAACGRLKQAGQTCLVTK